MPPAARVTDWHECPMVDPGPVPHVGGPILPPCQPNVLVGNLPQARVTDLMKCIGGAIPDLIIQGSPTVMVGNLPAARAFDMTAHGGMILMGCPTVIIGDGGSAGGTLSDAKKMGAPFAQKCGS